MQEVRLIEGICAISSAVQQTNALASELLSLSSRHDLYLEQRCDVIERLCDQRLLSSMGMGMLCLQVDLGQYAIATRLTMSSFTLLVYRVVPLQIMCSSE